MDIPDVPQRGAVSPPAGKETEPFAFARATSKIPRGTMIAAFPGLVSIGDIFSCTMGKTVSREWTQKLNDSWTGEKGESFYDAMKAAGYNVLGDPSELFDLGDDRARAKYQVGARLVDVRGNFCTEYDIWWGYSTNRITGEMYVKVEWEVYSTAESRIVGKFVTEGYGRLKEPSGQGIERTLNLAFANAASNLAGDIGFYNVLAPKDAVAEAAPHRGGAERQGPLTLRGARLSTHAMRDVLPEVLDAAVTIRLSNGHGSGFFISYDGYGLTNDHVAGASKTVMVRLRSGIEVEAEVVRTDKIRDVALFKAPVQMLHPLPLAPNSGLSRLDDVYAVGTPLKFALQSTVTKGVVSAFRREEKGGRIIDFIQADAVIASGNSGGPLLDAKGNVVGISVQTTIVQGVPVGFNRFIPIGEALEALNLTVEAEKNKR